MKSNATQIEHVTAFRTPDDNLFLDENKAVEHLEDLIGQALDDLLPHDDRGNVTQNDRFNLLTKQLKDPKLKSKIATLHHLLNAFE